jgi:demethylmenaquinone methyltransferase/2-methoxy-6-polyprenyl-1,4-benzoquinol methylase
MTKAIRNIFSEIPETYELVNHILTFGLDVLWRKRAVKIAVKSGGARWIDVCTGTGETASYLCRFAKNGTEVYAADFSLPMLREAKEKPEGGCIKFLLSDVENLPFSDNTFDLITISFATRNINRNQNILIRTFKDEWMELDRQYIDNWSLWLDIKILARTIPAVFKGSGEA